MLHGSEIWPVKKENEVALQRAEMSGQNIKVKEFQVELRERLNNLSTGTTARPATMVWA